MMLLKKEIKIYINSVSNLLYLNFLVKYFYFIFEEIINDYTEQEYLTIMMEKKNSPSEVYLQDISMKLYDTANNMRLSCIVSDEEKIFFIFNTSTILEQIEEDFEEDDLEEINEYINNQQIKGEEIEYNYEDL